MSQDWGNWDDQQGWNNQQSYPQHRNTGYDNQQQDYYSQQTAGYSNSQQSGYDNGYSGQQYGQSNMYLPQAAQQFMSDPMMNAARQIGGQFAAEQKEKISKYLSGFQLKYYFAVDSSYVAKKLGLLLFPFFHRDWSLKYGGSDEPVPAKNDVNAPDLYIPVMSFLTYVLVSGFVLGTQDRFTPEMLGILTSNAFIWVIIENIIIFVANTYKFFGMIICLLMFMIGGKTIYYSTLAYTSLALVFFLLRTIKNFVLDIHHSYNSDDGRKRKLMLVLFIVISQPLIMWWLTSGVTSFEYGKYDFARMAMDKMGIAEGVKADVPLTAEGDVDYEALLKMPK